MKRIRIIGVISFLFIMLWMLYLNQLDYKDKLNYNFKGEVEEVRYDIKGIPYVKINRVTYYLSYNNWSFNHNIQVGDSIEKLKNDIKIRLIKRKTREVIVYPTP